MAQTYVETGRYVVEPMRYRGYRRHYVPARILDEERAVKLFLDEVERAYNFTAICNYRKARVWVEGLKAVIALPLVSAIVGLAAKKPVVVIDHEKYVDEAIDMINLLGAVAIVNHKVIHPEFVKILWMTADFPIIFVSEEPPVVEHARVDLRRFIDAAHLRPGIVKIITETYGIKLDERELAELSKMTAQDFLNTLERLALTGRIIPAFKRF
jgi:hypothetical protein